ncbi:hypothetical protein CEXT_682131 [Caerostris extrusa]|uniref:Uncharacterized protein n=1 Tax=Caerostris extrusa TaxID=172846 RepID=A0AAV4UFI8_CAEEX|nr:hypothetical protein CEXT_682131 [Caerostris extrusa]
MWSRAVVARLRGLLLGNESLVGEIRKIDQLTMQQPIRLYKQCQMQVINYFKTGWVKRSSDNPFCPLPCGVYHDLIDYTLSLPFHEVPEISSYACF